MLLRFYRGKVHSLVWNPTWLHNPSRVMGLLGSQTILPSPFGQYARHKQGLQRQMSTHQRVKAKCHGAPCPPTYQRIEAKCHGATSFTVLARGILTGKLIIFGSPLGGKLSNYLGIFFSRICRYPFRYLFRACGANSVYF